jgi:hypothetical protein
MDSLAKIVERIESPLFFTAEADFDRLSLVKNLETVMISLAQQIKN